MSTPGWERLKANKRRVNAKSATQNIPSDHANQAAVRGLMLATPLLCPLAPSTTLPLYSTTASQALRGEVLLDMRGPRGGGRFFRLRVGPRKLGQRHPYCSGR